jgi:D-arabinonate dehydratase/D-galactarolactone cycloisomerase
MRITRLTGTVVTAPISKPWRIGHYVLDKGYAVIVEIETDEGVTGVGEALARLGGSASKSLVDDLIGPALLGADPLNIEGLWQRLFNLMRLRGHTRGYFVEALSGIDIALWDIAGKVAGVPIHRLLYGCGRTELPVYASSIFWDSPPAMAATAEELAAQGFDAIKIKVGQGVEQDVECLKVIRRAVGESVRLTVDANGAYGVSDAIRLARKMERFDVRWFEEPVPADDLAGYATLAARTDIPIAAGEAEFSIYGVKELLTRGVRVIQPDVGRAGGITESRRIAAFAEAFHVPYAPHTGASSAVCMAASLQVAAAAPNFLVYEHMVGENPLATVLLTEALPEPKTGVITVPQGPGLGISLDRRALEKYRVA